jgi:hypothetical protein
VTLPSLPVANARALAKARWLLSSYMLDYWTTTITALGAPYGIRPAWWAIGGDLTADPNWRDTQAAVSVTPVSSVVRTDAAADGTPFGSQNITAIWSVVCAVNTSTYGLDTAPLAAQIGCLVAVQILTERMTEPTDAGDTTVWSCVPLSDAASPVYPGDSAHVVLWRADIEVTLRADYRCIRTRWPGLGLTPYGAAETGTPGATLEVTGDALRSIAPAQSGTIAALSYTVGLTLDAGAAHSSLVCVNQTTYQTHTLADGGTITPAQLSTAPGHVWTVSSVSDTTNAITTWFIVWT